MGLLALHSGILLAVRFFLPEAEDLASYFFLGGVLASVPIYSFQKRIAVSAVLLGFLTSILAHIVLYKSLTGLNFNLVQVVLNPLETYQSVVMFFDVGTATFLLIEFWATTIIVAWLFKKVSSFVPAPKARSSAILKNTVSTLLLVVAANFAYKLLLINWQSVAPFEVRFEGGNLRVPENSEESLIILQLESVNGNALFKREGDRVVPRADFAGLKKLESMGGSWFPFFWSNTFGTNLGMSSILCGTSGSLSTKFVSPTDGSFCLPKRFQHAGFETSFYYSYRAADFYKLHDHVNTMGFQNFLFGEKLMKPEDPNFSWGYEDCAFYRRTFDHLHASGADQRKKLFVYMSVHMSHSPFNQHLDIPHPYSKPSNKQETYFNSAYEQDYCMAQFLTRVEQLGRDDLNVLIVGDHSVPLGVGAPVYDQHMTSFYFLPSRQRAKEFKSGPLYDFSPAQDQIQSTVLELFDPNAKSPASFLWALKGEQTPADYRKCHLISHFSLLNGYVAEGDTVLERSLRDGKYRLWTHKGNDFTSTELKSADDWKLVKISRSCLDRLGVPTH